jgi:hypothetical protein
MVTISHHFLDILLRDDIDPQSSCSLAGNPSQKRERGIVRHNLSQNIQAHILKFNGQQSPFTSTLSKLYYTITINCYDSI